MSVTQDGTSGLYRPANAGEWTTLLAGTGIANPVASFSCQESSGNLVDSINSYTLVPGSTPTYQRTISGQSAKAVGVPGGGGGNESFQSGWSFASGGSALVFAFMDFPATANAAERNSITFGGVYAHQVGLVHKLSSNPTLPALMTSLDTLTNGTVAVDSGVQPIILQANKTNSTAVVQTQYETISHAFVPPPVDSLGNLALGGPSGGQFWQSTDDSWLFVACWDGTDAEIDATKRAALINAMMNGPLPVTSNGNYYRRLLGGF